MNSKQIVSAIKSIPNYIRRWWKSLLIAFGNKIGMIPFSEHMLQINELKKRNAEISRLCAKKEVDITHLEQKLKDLPFDFDELLANYNISKLNALMYRIINNLRNDVHKRDYLERWEKRLNNARTTLQPDGEEGLDD